jgi:hypothetical protein
LELLELLLEFLKVLKQLTLRKVSFWLLGGGGGSLGLNGVLGLVGVLGLPGFDGSG